MNCWTVYGKERAGELKNMFKRSFLSQLTTWAIWSVFHHAWYLSHLSAPEPLLVEVWVKSLQSCSVDTKQRGWSGFYWTLKEKVGKDSSWLKVLEARDFYIHFYHPLRNHVYISKQETIFLFLFTMQNSAHTYLRQCDEGPSGVTRTDCCLAWWLHKA